MNEMEVSYLLQLFTDENRVKICKFLLDKEDVCESELLQIVDCDQKVFSSQMRLLMEANLVLKKEDNNQVYYSINNELIVDLVNFLQSACKGMNK